MKKTITKIAFMTGLISFVAIKAQTTITFDDLTLQADTFYENHSGTDWQSSLANFRYSWDNAWAFWSGGSAYTNKKDTINTFNPSFTYFNTYSAITGTGFSGNNYLALQDGAVITFTNSTTALQGFYVTNSTYAWKVIKNGNSNARKFGDTTGTGSGNSIQQGEYPDWFRLVVYGYQDGLKKADSVNFYLADYRPAGKINDYAVKNWQYVDCSAVGEVDSVQFVLRSSDSGTWGINTPGFFSIDNMILSSTTAIEEIGIIQNMNVFPNPTKSSISLSLNNLYEQNVFVSILDISGKIIFNEETHMLTGDNKVKLNTENLDAGIYFIELRNENTSKKIKFIKL